jgi:hypothetical protein
MYKLKLFLHKIIIESLLHCSIINYNIITPYYIQCSFGSDYTDYYFYILSFFFFDNLLKHMDGFKMRFTDIKRTGRT